MCGQVLVEVLFIHFNPRELVCVLLRIDSSEMCVCLCMCDTGLAAGKLLQVHLCHYLQGSI